MLECRQSLFSHITSSNPLSKHHYIPVNNDRSEDNLKNYSVHPLSCYSRQHLSSANTIFFFEMQIYRNRLQTWRTRLSIQWLTPKMLTPVGTGLCQSQEPGTLPRSPMWQQQHNHFFVVIWCLPWCTLAGSWSCKQSQGSNPGTVI